jgi:hypothetical protein
MAKKKPTTARAGKSLPPADKAALANPSNPPPAAPPRKPEDVRQQWANVAALLGEQERKKLSLSREYEKTEARIRDLHVKLDVLDNEYKFSTEYHAAKPPQENTEVKP